MPLPTTQKIKVGAAALLIGTSPTDVISSGITTTVYSASSPPTFAATVKQITVAVGTGSTIAPDVWDGTGTQPDPLTIDVILHLKSGECFHVWKVDTDTLYVIRSMGIYWTKFDISKTTYGALLTSGDELQLLGSYTLPTRADAVTTAEDVVINSSQDYVTTMDNQKGNETSYSSAPSDNNFTCSLPRNTLASTMSAVGIQSITDGDSPARKFIEPGKMPVGIELPTKFIVIMPNNTFFNPSTVTLDTVDYLDLNECYLIPRAQFNLNQSRTFSPGNQANLECEFRIAYDEVWQKPIHFGATAEMCRIAEQIV